MTRQEHRCWSITCDVCGDGWACDVPHFDSAGEADEFAWVQGWTVTALRVICPDCTAAEGCALTGHAWEAWQKLGPLPRSDGSVWEGRVRYCLICTWGEWDPPIKAPDD